MKHSKQLEESKANSAAAIKELEHLQNEKRKMLMEHETAKLKELDESYSGEFTEWKNNLKPRKQVGPFQICCTSLSLYFPNGRQSFPIKIRVLGVKIKMCLDRLAHKNLYKKNCAAF